MKKFFFYAMLAVGMTAACQKPDVNVDNPDLDDNSPVEVVFGVKAPSITVTKTKAAVDDWAAENIYVYGYDIALGTTTDGPKFELANMLIQGAEATVETVSDTNEEEADRSGLSFTANGAGVTKYYYEVDSVYDFYGYYVGDASINEGPTVDATSKKITATVTIDGDDDIMLANTDHDADVDRAQEEFPDATINEDYVYSAYAARRGVHPTLNFAHKLTRFTFHIVQGYSPNTEDGHTKPVEITNIAIETNNVGTIDLTAQTFTPTSATAELNFPITDGNPEDEPKEIADIMLFPTDQSLVFNVSLQPVKDDANADPNTDNLELKDMIVTLDPTVIAATTSEKKFKEGQRYNVTLTVYDLEEVQVSASLTEWGDGEDTVYDPDNDLDEDAGATIVETAATLEEEDVTLYSKVAIADGVRVYQNKALTKPAKDGNYTTATASFTVSGGKGVVSAYTEI